MNLIQQAVERAEREPKMVASPLPHLPSLGHVHSRSFRPVPMSPSRAPLAAAALALLALLGGAGLYAALARTQAERSATPLQATKPVELPLVAVKAVQPVVSTAAVAATAPAVVATATGVPNPLPVTPAAPASNPADEAKATVEAWARAWSERDVATYLGYYGDGFAPENKASRAAWEKARRQMIERRRNIAVTVRDLRVEPLSDERVVARYTQDYVADAYRESGTSKRLVLAREGQVWRIVAEASDKSTPNSL